MTPLNPTKYNLQCVATSRTFQDEGWMIDDPQSPTPSLIRAMYDKKQLTVGSDSLGIYKYADWMPISHSLNGSSAPITYKSEKLAGTLNLENLYITISGYMPERGAKFETCSFKETEAYSVCGRIDPSNKKILVVSSAGNTARAFAKVCSDNNIKLLLCVPEDNLDALWFSKPLNDCVKLIAAQKGADYFDAIHLGNIAVESPMFYAEGGAKNVARRDGMGTTYLSAATHIGELPHYYFQAIGSGTGAIAAWEANMRLIEDGRYGSTKTKLLLSQNAPFLVMHDSWKINSRQLTSLTDEDARKAVEQIDAKVLSNRKPPYSISGGVFDALTDTGGDIKKISNQAAALAADLFEQTEGIDIHPAAAVAVASLIDAVNNNEIEKDKIIMLNITGAGSNRYAKEHPLTYLKPSAIFPINPNKDSVLKIVEKLF